MEDGTPGSREFREIMEFLGGLNAEDDLPGGVRVIFTPAQKEDARRILSLYDGTASRGALATPDQALLRQSRRLLMAVRARNRDIGFLEPSEREGMRRLLARRRWRIHWTRSKIAAAIVAGALVVMAFIGFEIVRSLSASDVPSVSSNQGLPPADVPPLTRTDLQKTLNLFGPWHTIAPTDQRPDSAQPAVLMLKQDGGIIASQRWTIPFDLSVWERQDSTYIGKLSVVGTYVRLETTTQRSFIVHVDQPFIFEQAPEQVYLVDEAGHVWYVNLAQATGLRGPLH